MSHEHRFDDIEVGLWTCQKSAKCLVCKRWFVNSSLTGNRWRRGKPLEYSAYRKAAQILAEKLAIQSKL